MFFFSFLYRSKNQDNKPLFLQATIYIKEKNMHLPLSNKNVHFSHNSLLIIKLRSMKEGKLFYTSISMIRIILI